MTCTMWVKKKNNKWYFKPLNADIDYFCALIAENSVEKLSYIWACTKSHVSSKELYKMGWSIKKAILEIPKLING